MANKRGPYEQPTDLPELATAGQVAEYLHTNVNSLAQMRYRGNGPKFIKVGRLVRYRWADVLDWLAQNTMRRTDGQR
jgi:predicted DNA-binding transcriptional regulator AlpA